TKLQQHQEAEKALQEQLSASGNPKERAELEARLAETRNAQAQLLQNLDESQRALKAQQESFKAEQARLEAQVRALQTAKAEAEQKVEQLSQSLAEEDKEPEKTEPDSGVATERKGVRRFLSKFLPRRRDQAVEPEAQLVQAKQAAPETPKPAKAQSDSVPAS